MSAASLQRQVSNSQPATSSNHVALALQRKCACGSTKPASSKDECEDCKDPNRLQAKLTIGANNDPLEREADRIADQVVSARGPYEVNTAPLSIQRVAGQTASGIDVVPASVDRVLSGSGTPLEPATRQDMEQRFGHDFSRVRVHSGTTAGQSASDVNAQAFTVGHNIVFGEGQFVPGTNEGRRLIAHELTHVVQQREGAQTFLRRDPKPPQDPQKYDKDRHTVIPETAIPLAEAQERTQRSITDGDLTAATVSGAKAGSVEEIMLHVILAQVATSDLWGSEMDIIAPIGFTPAGGGAAPMGKVTIRIDTAGKGDAMLVSAGEVVLPSAYKTREDAEAALKTKYGIAEVRDADATWELAELNQVATAFTRLPAGDLMVLKGVVLERVHAIQNSDGDFAGEFESKQDVNNVTVTNDAFLRLTDSVFPATQTNFTGGATNAAVSGYLTILHEVGHAVATKAERDAFNAKFTATAARNELVNADDQAIEAANTERAAFEPLRLEYNALVEEVNNLTNALNEAIRSGADKEAIAALRADRDAKNKERIAKLPEVTAQETKVKVADAAEKARHPKIDAATATEKSKTALAEKTKARPVLLANANAAETVAIAALSRAKSATAAPSEDSAGYRSAVDQASQDLSALAKAVKANEDASGVLSTARDALTAVEGSLASLTTEHPADPALAAFAPVDKAHRAWFDALERTIDEGGETERVRKFVDFVNSKKITPFTEYAKTNWPAKPEEFFAEAYSLFLSDPEYLLKNSAALHAWFTAGSYR